MSHVTNAILSFDILEDEEARMAEVNAACLARGNQQFGPDLGDWHDAYGGYKALETPLYVAAFNGFVPGDIIAAVGEASWDFPQLVQLIAQDQHDDKFWVWPLHVGAA